MRFKGTAGASWLCAVPRRMHEELKSAGGSARLASQVASCISKALQLLAEKAEYMAATGDSACLLMAIQAVSLG